MSRDNESRQFFEGLDKTKPLAPNESKKVRNYVLAYYLGLKIRLTIQDIESLALDIENSFPCEKKEIYFNPQTKTGLLYTDYHNKAKALRTTNLYPSYRKSRPKKRRIEEVEPTSSFLVDSTALQSDEIVKAPSSDLELKALYSHWGHSSVVRLQKIKQLKPEQKVTDILDEYSLYKRADGHIFVSN